MKKNDLQPSFENIKNTFIDDSIGRNNDLFYFINLINSIDESYSIALDSLWGSGKTFFVKQTKMILDVNNDFTYDAENDSGILNKWRSLVSKNKLELANEYKLKQHVTIYYDAWENDNDNDPIFSIIYQIVKETGKYDKLTESINFGDVLDVAGKITKAISGVDPNNIAASFKKTDFLDSIRTEKNIHDRITEFIDDLLPEHGDRLLIIVDELDRCNPHYAVKLLERIKHYFDNDNITFIFSVNMLELQHTINNFYGSEFNASKYLDRFFDIRVSLPSIDLKNYLLGYDVGQSNYLDISINKAIKRYNMQLREVSKYIPVIKKACDYDRNRIPHNTNNVILNIILPLAIALHFTNLSKYNSFINGGDSSELKAYLHDFETLDALYSIVSLIIFEDRFADKSAQDLIDNPELLDKGIDEFYNALFKSDTYITVGMCKIDSSERVFLQQRLSFLY